MESPPKEGLAWAAASVLALPTFLLPLYNPDLFWHLSAGRWILDQRALPKADFLSFTMSGSPWLDFEWLSQLIFQGVYGLGGMAGLWLFKMAMLLLCGLILLQILRLHRVPPAGRAAAFAAWALGLLGNSDIRPELFSMAGFSAVLYILERGRLGRGNLGPRRFLGIMALFAVWTALHAGFTFGLALFAIYAGVALLERKSRQALEIAAAAAAAAAGSLCQPYGLGPYRVAREHWLARAQIAQYIQEWHPLSFDNPLHWPGWLLLVLGAALIIYRASSAGNWRGRLPWPLAAAALDCAAGMLLHSRLSPYFAISGVPLIFSLLPDSAGRRKLLAAGFVGAGAFLIWLYPRVSWGRAFDYKHVPRRAAEFLSRERTEVEPLKIYNPWEWGGYLGWRLGPWYRVYGDGRYIFHPQLPRTAEAFSDSGRWQAFLEAEKVDGALLPNLDQPLPTQKLYPDGKTRPFLRPWYLFYMPRERWALVYWDDQALFFVDRRRAPPQWLSRNEYRYVRPKDDAAFAEAVRLREIPADKLSEERARHEREAAATSF